MPSTQAESELNSETIQPLHEQAYSTLDTAPRRVATGDSANPDNVQLGRSRNAKHASGVVNLLLLPMSLPALSASQHYWRLIRRIRQEGASDIGEPVTSQSAPIKLAHTLTALDLLKKMLVEIPSQCRKAQHATMGTLCGAMTLFILVPLVGFRLFMVFVSITCIALFYILSDVPNVAQPLFCFGVPHNWTHNDDKLVVIFLALPNATIFLSKFMACVITVGVLVSCDLNILWPMEIIRVFQGALPQTSQSIEPTFAPKSPQWLYWTAASYLLLELIRCATVHHMLSRCLRKGYDNDGEKCPQYVSLQTPASNAVVYGLSNQTPNHSAFATHST